MGSDWHNGQLSEIANVVMGQSPSGDTCNTVGDGTPLLNGPTEFGSYHPFPEQYTTDSKKLSECGDLLFCVRGSTTGRMNWADQKYAIGRGIAAIRHKKGKEYQPFLRGLIENSLPRLLVSATGSTFPNVSRNQLMELEIKVPSLSEQRSIAHILGTLDDKIELNRKMNETLETMAQALFKSWFVDFEPWNSEKPVNWREGSLGQYVTIKRGGSPRPIQDYLSDTGLRWLKISDVTSLQSPFVLKIKEHIKESGLRKTVFLESGSLVLSNSATPGIPKILCIDTCIHDGWLYFPVSLFSNEYLYLFFKHIRQDLIALGNGSIFTNLKTDILKNYVISVPDAQTLQNFDKLVKVLFEAIESRVRESATLVALRDILLPKLISGQLRIKDAEKFLESHI